MGMTKASLDFQIQQETQKAISQLQQNQIKLDGILRTIDGNFRQAYSMLIQDITRLSIRINFLLSELKNTLPEDKQIELEERFKAFSEDAAAKMQKEIADAIAKKEKEDEEKTKDAASQAAESNLIKP